MSVYESGKVTSKGQVTIPVEVRRKLGIATDDKINVIIQSGEAKLEVSKHKKLIDLVGVLKTRQEHEYKYSKSHSVLSVWMGSPL
ncbi:hypothetical protein ASD24_16670 [Paenibacillus sp. Root52]|uniref:AbrB/MazE/SpoVT family DNA-binding domain-containing protein n=1 Tax=Paenibacillus sp. Root52 TaxID=1736552 RepID=UPI0006FA3EF8|nr:AbrB/MazE/SpoVT family DNA-binding domain-containing protein [Paenibacillus sp. Root52]KQY82272.1 hypothetical protein ASD24_16670 [Paenibacillus sp. Root52]